MLVTANCSISETVGVFSWPCGCDDPTHADARGEPRDGVPTTADARGEPRDGVPTTAEDRWELAHSDSTTDPFLSSAPRAGLIEPMRSDKVCNPNVKLPRRLAFRE